MPVLLKAIKPMLEKFAPDVTTANRLLTGIILLSLLVKLFLILHGGDPQLSILQMEYGFGPVITSLYEHHSLDACGVALGLDMCGVATRMPLLPALYVAFADVVGLQQSHVAIAKTVLCSALLWFAVVYFCRVLTRYPLHRLGLVALSALLFLGPQYLKHAISIQYEESLLIDWLPAYFLLLGALLVRQSSAQPLAKTEYAILAFLVLLGCSLYFLKSSMLAFGLTLIAAPLVLVKVPTWFRAVAFLPFLVGLIWWGSVNYHYHGEVRLGSSYNGENLYRGQNAYSYQVYPELNLDRLIDSSEMILNSGEHVPLPNWSRHYPAFKGEWQWHDYFKELNGQWVKEHPADAMAFTLRKIYVFFVEPRKVPFRQTTHPETEPHDYSPASLVAGIVWIVLLRVVFFISVALAIRALWRHRSLGNFALWQLLFIGSYSAPYLVGFSYQRHITPMLVFSAILLLVLTLPCCQRGQQGLKPTD